MYAKEAAILVSMYSHVAVFELNGEFLGYAIKENNNRTLQSTHLYAEDEGDDLTKRLNELNNSQAILNAWPDARDPEVQALVNDPTFEPIEMIEDEVLDEDNSYIIYRKEKGEDTFEIDHEASVLRYKIAKIPARPSDVMARTKKACEVVARSRVV